jgi:ribose-phosphate pyrophosphokinase
MSSELALFGLNENNLQLDDELQSYILPHTANKFPDGESYLKSNANVREKDVYIVTNINSDLEKDVNNKLIELMWFIGSLKDASAKRVTAIIRHLNYARQDRKTESRAPITIKYMAKTLEAVGLDRLLTMDVHNLSAFQNAFRIPVDNLDLTKLFAEYLISNNYINSEYNYIIKSGYTILSPDIGGTTRSSKLQRFLSKLSGVNVDLAIFDKKRIKEKNSSKSVVVAGNGIIGDVKDKNVIIFDDLISTGSTIKLAADAVEKNGGVVIAICASHGLFTESCMENLNNYLDKIIISDSVAKWNSSFNNYKDKIKIIDTKNLISEVIKRTHSGHGSISELLEI